MVYISVSQAALLDAKIYNSTITFLTKTQVTINRRTPQLPPLQVRCDNSSLTADLSRLLVEGNMLQVQLEDTDQSQHVIFL